MKIVGIIFYSPNYFGYIYTTIKVNKFKPKIMATLKKTLKRETLINRVNLAMKNDFFTNEQKLAIAEFTSALLLAEGAYNGYTLDHVEREEGEEHMAYTLREVSTRKYF